MATNRMRKLLTILFLISIAVTATIAQDKTPTIDARIRNLQKLDGYIPLYWDKDSGKLFMEVARFNQEFLYQLSLPAGVGANQVGLDRGQLGDTHVVFFEHIGPKVLLIEPNYRYRALTNDRDERRAVEESFARSVLWGFKVEAAEQDRVLVDATGFFVRDAHGVTDRLRESNQGQYRLDESRSAVYLPRTKAFPKNTEVEVSLTFTTEGNT